MQTAKCVCIACVNMVSQVMRTIWLGPFSEFSSAFSAVLQQHCTVYTVTDQNSLIDGVSIYHGCRFSGSLSLDPAAIKLRCDASGEHVNEVEEEASASAVSTSDKAESLSAAPSGWDLDPTSIPVSSQPP